MVTADLANETKRLVSLGATVLRHRTGGVEVGALSSPAGHPAGRGAAADGRRRAARSCHGPGCRGSGASSVRS
nr:hypothetical protein [Leekyejoonella antrihumi]